MASYGQRIKYKEEFIDNRFSPCNKNFRNPKVLPTMVYKIKIRVEFWFVDLIHTTINEAP